MLPSITYRGVRAVSLDKAIAHGKEKRKPYRGTKVFDKHCRNHGSCPWCRDNRLHKFRDRRSKEDTT